MGPLARAVGFVLAGAVSSFAPPADEACPPGSADAARAIRVKAILAATPDGERLAREGTGPANVCFVAGDGGLTAARVALLDRTASPTAQAARLGHLWQHVLDAAPSTEPAPGEACESWRARTAVAEARGDAVEARVARGLMLNPPLDRKERDVAYDARCLR